MDVARARLNDTTYQFVQRIRYVVMQLEECPTTQRNHLQGYFEINRGNVTLAMVKEVFPGAHVEKARGTRAQAREYCMKEDTRLDGPWEYGTFASTQGKRTDLHAAVESLVEGGMQAVVDDHPTVFVRYNRGLQALADRLQEGPAGDQHFVPRPWQARVVSVVEGEPDDRTVYWVTDTVGGRGKSRLARYLVDAFGAVYLSGRVADMALMLKKSLDRPFKPRVCVFDVSRAQAEYSDHLYSMAEMVKNGLVISNKYDSCQLRFGPMHVLFFSNQSWDRSKLSHDRVKEMNMAVGTEDQWDFV